MPARPRKGARFGGSAARPEGHDGQPRRQPIAAEAITTTEAKAKAMRPVAEKMITKAKRAASTTTQCREVSRDREMASKLFDEIGPRYEDRQGGYIRIIKLDPRSGTTRRWRVSSWSDLVRLRPVRTLIERPSRRALRRSPHARRRRPGGRPSLTTWPRTVAPPPMGTCASA